MTSPIDSEVDYKETIRLLREGWTEDRERHKVAYENLLREHDAWAQLYNTERDRLASLRDAVLRLLRTTDSKKPNSEMMATAWRALRDAVSDSKGKGEK